MLFRVHKRVVRMVLVLVVASACEGLEDIESLPASCLLHFGCQISEDKFTIILLVLQKLHLGVSGDRPEDLIQPLLIESNRIKAFGRSLVLLLFADEVHRISFDLVHDLALGLFHLEWNSLRDGLFLAALIFAA